MDYSTLREQISKEIQQSPIASTNARALKQMIDDKTATYATVGEYSKVLGDVASKSIQRNIADGIADDELSAFANKCLAPVYRQCQDTMLNACRSVQKVFNEEEEIDLKPVDVKRDESRITHIIERFEGEETFEDLKFLTNANVARSITRGAVNDSMKANAKFHSDAGLKETLSRSDGAGCCDWCAGLVGTYDSFDKIPSDFWSVHRGCTCVINYYGTKVSYRTHDNGSLTKVAEEYENTSVEKSSENGKINLDLQNFANKSKHAEERENERKIPESAIDDAINNPLFKGNIVIDEEGRKSIKYIGKEATVIINPDTDTEITTWKTSSRIRKKYESGD